MRRRVRSAGFTLVEMMVALTAGAIAIGSIYYVSAASSQHFFEQQELANMQTAVRLAMDRIRADFQRAGFLGSVNPFLVQEGAFCGGLYADPTNPEAALMGQGLFVEDGAYDGQLTNAGTNVVQADRVRLVGNYATADEYPAMVSIAGQNVVTVQPGDSQAFQRSFGASTDPADYEAAFEAAFAPGRGLRIVHETGRISLHQITGVAAPNITFQPALTSLASPQCQGVMANVLVAPLVRIEYRVADWAIGVGGKFVGSTALSGQNDGALVRQELIWNSAVAAAADANAVNDATYDFTLSRQVVLEHVAEFDVDLIADSRASAAFAPDFVLWDEGDSDGTDDLDGAASATNNTHGANTGTAVGGLNGPHRVRSAIVRLSVRSATEDVRFPFEARTDENADLLRYELDAARPGAARVRSLRSEIFLPNFAYRGRL